MKKTVLIFLVVALLFAGASCSTQTEKVQEKETVRVLALKGPTGIGMAKLMAENDAENGANDYDFTIFAQPTEVAAEVIAGRFDIAAVPANLAATLYNKTSGGVKVAAVNTLGVLYILENGNTVNSIGDLKGKTIGATGQGAVPEYVLNYLLSENGLVPGVDVNIEYYDEHTELAAQLASGTVKIGMLPQPNVTSAMAKNADLRVAVDINEVWNGLDTGSGLTQGCIIVSKDFAENHSEALEAFLKEYRASAEFAVSNVAETAEICAEKEIIPSKELAEKAIPLCNICYIDGTEMKEKLAGFLEVLYNADSKSVGGKLPGEDFYFG